MTEFPLQEWVDLGVTFEGVPNDGQEDDLTLYLNGQKKETWTDDMNWNSDAGGWSLAYGGDHFGNYKSHSYFERLLVFDEVLTPEEMAALSPEQPDPLTLTADRDTGEVTISNTNPFTGFTIPMNGYTITSAAGSLVPVGGWTSLDSVNFGDGMWQEGGSVSENVLAEANLQGGSNIDSNASVSLGNAWDPAAAGTSGPAAEDLVFNYSITGGGGVVTGLVQYIGAGFITGDLDCDGDIDFDDIDDFVTGLTNAQQYENQFGLAPEVKGDTDGDGDIDFDDIDDFVMILTGGPISGSSQSVPEPSTLALFGLAVSIVLGQRIRARRVRRPGPR